MLNQPLENTIVLSHLRLIVLIQQDRLTARLQRRQKEIKEVEKAKKEVSKIKKIRDIKDIQSSCRILM